MKSALPILSLILFFFSIGNTFAQMPQPVASYPFSGNANDVSGQGNHGILSGSIPTLTTDRFNNPNSAYKFGGYFSPSWILVPNSPSLQFNKHFSISLWYKQCEIGGMDGWGGYSQYGANVLYGKAGDGYAAAPGIYSVSSLSASGAVINSFNNKLCYGGSQSCYQFSMFGAVPCYDSCEWIHVVHVVDSNIARMYINGHLIDSSTTNAPANFTVANSKPLYIGKMDGSWYPFNGVIDDINIYNVALNQQQVNILFDNYIDPLAFSLTASQDTVCLGSSVTLTANGGNTYNWLPNASLSNINYNTATATPTNTTTYKVVISKANMCVDTVEKTVVVNSCNLCADTSLWIGSSYTINSSNNPYYTPQQWIDNINGWAYIPPALVPWSYYWTQFTLKDTMCITNDFSIEFKIKSGPPTGISAYDTYLGIKTTNGVCGMSLMGEAWGQPWTGIYILGNTVLSNSSSLIFPSLSSWTTVKMEFLNNNLNYYVNNQLFFTGPYTGNICNINGIETRFKGSAYIDWIKIRDNQNNIVYLEDFISCDSLKGFEDNCPDPIIQVDANYNSCINDTLSLYANVLSQNNYLEFSWTGPNGFTSSAQNPFIINPNINAAGWYYCIASTNICNPSFTDSVFVNVQSNIDITMIQSICQGSALFGYSSPGTYVDTFSSQNGCDSIRTLYLSVNHPTDTTITKTICFPQSFLGYGTSGNYSDTLTKYNGCDSIRLIHLIVNQPSDSTIINTICFPQTFLGYGTTGNHTDTFINSKGCDSIRTIHLTVNLPTDSTITKTICFPQTFLGYSTSGNYTDTFTNFKGCDSIRTINLIVNQPTDSTITKEICFPQNFLGYSLTGSYIDTFTNAKGCDSIRTIHLTVNQTTDTTINKTICAPQTFLGYGTSGNYTDIFINSKGCDSIRTIHLTVNQPTDSTITNTICFPQTFLGYGTTGIYTDTFINSKGCDSIRTIHLIVNLPTDTTITNTICFPQSFLGYGTSGNYTDVFTNSKGCDSIRTIHLTVNQTTDTTITKAICNPQSFLGYNNTGTYLDTFINSKGCDSIRTINLIVHQIQDTIINVSICAGESFAGYSINGIFIDTFNNQNFCDSIRTINLIVNNPTSSSITDTVCRSTNIWGYTSTGIYVDTFVNQNGCDSIRTLDLYIFPSDTVTVNPYICFGNNYLGYSSSGQYTLVYPNYLGCDSITIVNLTVSESPTIIDIDTISCSAFYFDGNLYSETQSLIDTFKNTFGCDSFIRNIKIFVDDFVLNLETEFTEMYVGEPIYLRTNAHVDYKIYAWEPSSWFNNQNLKEQAKILQDIGEFRITVFGKSGYNCLDSASVTLIVLPINDAIFIPNAFTPNGDGLNDIFEPKFTIKRGYSIQNFIIFNRYGQIVYNGHGSNLKWDGNYNGKNCDAGVYYYQIKIKFNSGKEKSFKGDLQLLR